MKKAQPPRKAKPWHRARGVWLCGLLSMLVLWQMCGVVHRVVHGHAGAFSVVSQSTALFENHEAGGVQCQLLDHLSHADWLDGLPLACTLTQALWADFSTLDVPFWLAKPGQVRVRGPPPFLT